MRLASSALFAVTVFGLFLQVCCFNFVLASKRGISVGVGMDTHLRRRSVFPPLLRPNARLSSTRRGSSHLHEQPGEALPDNHLVRGREEGEVAAIQRSAAGSEPGKAVRVCVQSPRAEKSAKKLMIRNPREEELLRKKAEKADALVRKWDTLLVKEKEDKCAELLQRLELQHKLIAKTDNLSRQLGRKEEEKQAKELQSRREFQRQMMQNLRAHNWRINEHKRKVAEKLRSSGIRPVSRPVSHAYPEPTPDPQLRGLAEESTTEQITLPGQSDNQSAPRTAHSRLHQLLRFDPVREATPTIPAAWNTLKHDTENRMLPFEAYSHYTRQFANPTARHLLQYYDQPVAVDMQSREKVPLLEVLQKEAQIQQMGQGAQSILTNAIELKTRRNQVRAEMLLDRKQAQADIPMPEPALYVPNDEYELQNGNEMDTRPRFSEKRPTVPVKHLHTNPQAKKRLPKYLAQNGDLVSGSLEEVGERMYLRPTKEKRNMQTEKAETGGDTLMHERPEPPRKRRWHPLSSSAAEEYEGTRVVPMKASSDLGHGKYSMWKPQLSHTPA